MTISRFNLDRPKTGGPHRFDVVSGCVRDPPVNLATKRPEIDWLGQKSLGAFFQRLSLGLRIAVSGYHGI